MLDKIKLTIKNRFISFMANNKEVIYKALFPAINVIQLNSYKELQKFFKLSNEPVFDESHIHLYQYPYDVNSRRLRDAESIMTICANTPPPPWGYP